MMKTLLALTLAALTTSTAALACSCREGTVSDHFENADIVATAKVLTIKKQKNEEWPQLVVSLQTKLSWKGEPDEKITLTTADNSAACGYGFEKRKEYLLFIHRDEKGALSTSLCSGNEPIGRAKDSLDWLNKHHPIEK